MVASLPPARFATGSAVLNMCRQIGAVLGVAVHVAINDSAHGVNLLANFQTQRVFLVLAALLAGGRALGMGAVRSLAPVSEQSEPGGASLRAATVETGARAEAQKCGRASTRLARFRPVMDRRSTTTSQDFVSCLGGRDTPDHRGWPPAEADALPG